MIRSGCVVPNVELTGLRDSAGPRLSAGLEMTLHTGRFGVSRPTRADRNRPGPLIDRGIALTATLLERGAAPGLAGADDGV